MNFVLPFVLSFGLALILIPVTIFFAKRYGFVDDPKRHKHPALLHKKSVPRAGGLPIFLAFLVTTLLVIPFSQTLSGVLLGALVLVLAGVLDDKFDLKTWHKFTAQILAALIVVGSGIGISFITNPFYSFGSLGESFGEVIRLDTIRIFFDFLGTHSIVVFADLFAFFGLFGLLIWLIFPRE